MFLKLIKAIFSAIFWLIKKVFGFLFKVVVRFRLYFIVLYLIVCAVLQAVWNVFSGENGSTIFFIFLAFFSVITVYLNIIAVIRKADSKKRKRERTAKKKTKPYKGEEYRDEDIKPEREKKKRRTEQSAKKEKTPPSPEKRYPVYYKVDGTNDFIMAEYEDVYQLFYIQDGSYVLVRTDYKN